MMSRAPNKVIDCVSIVIANDIVDFIAPLVRIIMEVDCLWR
jgi:hypothetical protein